MKHRLVVRYVLFLLIGMGLFQPVWAQGNDKTLVTKSGETYHNYKITTANAQGITIKHSSGTASVTPENWPDNKKDEIVPYLPIVAEKRNKLINAQKDVKTEPSSSDTPGRSSSYSESSKSSKNSTGAKTVQVKSYTRKDGTVVRAHTRSAPRRR